MSSGNGLTNDGLADGWGGGFSGGWLLLSWLGGLLGGFGGGLALDGSTELGKWGLWLLAFLVACGGLLLLAQPRD